MLFCNLDFYIEYSWCLKSGISKVAQRIHKLDSKRWKESFSGQDVAVSTLKHGSAELWWQNSREHWCEQVAEEHWIQLLVW